MTPGLMKEERRVVGEDSTGRKGGRGRWRRRKNIFRIFYSISNFYNRC